MVGEGDREKELRSLVLVAFDLTSSTDCITYRHYHCNDDQCSCKAGIMTSEDMINAYNDQWINFLDPLLAHLLKASQDKKFVCEAAEKAL